MPKAGPFGTRPAGSAEQGEILASILSSSTEYSIIAADLDGRIIVWNEGARRNYGYEPDEVIGKDVAILHAAEGVRDGTPNRIRDVARQTGVWLGELTRRRKDGSTFTAHVTLNLRRDAKGSPSGFTLISRNIAEAKRLHAELAEYRDLLSRAIEVSPHGMILVDPNGQMVLVNQQTCAIFGYSEAELLGQQVEILLPQPLRPAHAVLHAEYLRTPAARQMGHGRELKGRRKDGREIYVEIGLAPVPRGGQPFVIASIIDVTQRRENLARLEWLSLVVEQSPIAVVMTDVHGTIEYVNAAFSANTGYSAEEVIGKNPRMLQSGETPVAVYQDLWATIKQGRPWRGELVNRRKDGTKYTDAMWVYPIKDASGQVIRMLALKEDVTQRRSLEQQLRQAQRMESIGRLAGGVAHDFNNILTAILGYTELLLERFAPGSAEHDDLREVQKASQRASSLTRQLLAFSRQQVLQPVVLNPNDVIENLQKMLGRIVGEDVTLRLVQGPNVGNFKADPGQIEQVLMNLVVNARDAMPDGGSLIIETSNADLDEQYAEDHSPVIPGRYVLLAVSDTGTGISPEVKARIFEPFFTTKELGKGTGLGLSTVYGIVKQSGGYIWVYSEGGKGTTFKLYFPRVDAPVADGTSAARPEQLSGSETILLAEDDETLRALTRSTLGKLGYRVLPAATAAEALELATWHDGPIHLLLTDVVMPGGNGRELARAVAGTRPATKVLFMSGYTGEAMVQHGLSDAGTNYLQKPYTPSGLAVRVREVLSKE